MKAELPPTVPHLYSAVAAYLNGDAEAVNLLLDDIEADSSALEVTCAAVMATGEYLRSAAESRAMAPTRLLDVLRVAHQSMTCEHCDTPEGAVLGAVGRYLRGESDLWSPEQGAAFSRDTRRTARAAITVTSAALAWHARDSGAEATLMARTVCLSLASRQCHLTS